MLKTPASLASWHLDAAGCAGQLHRRQHMHRDAGGADRMALRFEPARGIDRQPAVLLGPAFEDGARALALRRQPHRLVFDQLGDGEAVMGLDQIEIVEAEPRLGQRALPGSAGPSNATTSRRLIGRKSLTCSAARKTTAFFRLSAVRLSASTTAAAPSETSEQSVRCSGPATSGFLSRDRAAEFVAEILLHLR